MTRMICFVALLCAVSAWAAEKPLLAPNSSAEYRRAFTFATDGWQADGAALVGMSPQYYSLPETALESFPDDPWTYFTVHPVNLWRYALAGEAEWADYTLAATVTIEDPAPLKGFRPGSYFFNYQWGREAIGSDAGLIVRYTDDDNYYLVRLSSGYDHVELWKTHGGVVQVAAHDFAPNRPAKIEVTVSGRWIIVRVDGKERIRYADPLQPLRNGRVGLGVRESRARFTGVQVIPAAHIDTPVPPHKPDFRLKRWVGRDYIFDGDEPIGFLFPGANGLAFAEVKLQPGLMPLVTPYVGMSTYTYRLEYTRNITDQGKSFAMTAQMHDKDDGFVCDADWSITYEPDRGYVWDKRATVTVLKDKALTAWPELDDPFFYQLCAPVTDKLPACSRALKYCIKQVDNGLTLAYPNAQHIWVDALGGVDTGKAFIRPGGANVTTVDGWGVVCEVPADNSHRYATGYCHWGLDQHLHETTHHRPVKGERFSGHVRYSLWTPERVQAELARSVSPPQLPNRPPSDQRIAHVEPVNRCTAVYPGLTGASVRLWTGNYTVDHAVGRGDTTSMRIDAATIVRRSDGQYGDERPNIWLGPTYWTGPYLAPRYRFGAWVKADNFTGKVALRAENFDWTPAAKSKFPVAQVELPIQGKCDWTYVTFEGGFPRKVFNWVLRIDPVGTGVVWVDDFEVTPLAK